MSLFVYLSILIGMLWEMVTCRQCWPNWTPLNPPLPRPSILSGFWKAVPSLYIYIYIYTNTNTNTRDEEKINFIEMEVENTPLVPCIFDNLTRIPQLNRRINEN